MLSKVYILSWNKNNEFERWLDITPLKTQIKPNDFVAIKIHFGEKGNRGYINPNFARIIVKKIKELNANPFLTDTNTIYVGQRADAIHHLQTAADHGFTLQKCGCPIIIADGLRGNSGLEVEVNLKHFKTVSIANAIYYSESLVFLSHFKGHELTGFGGTIKNIGMGCATRAGKYSMHDRLKPYVNTKFCIGCGNCIKWCSQNALSLIDSRISLNESICIGCGECILSCPKKVFHIPWDENTHNLQEKIVEYAYGVLKGKSYFFINFLNFITKYCDCYKTKEEPLIDDIAILASIDPVALDQASVDLINDRFGKDFFQYLHPNINWQIQLDYAEYLGLGSRKYNLINYEQSI